MFNLKEELKNLPDKPGVYIMHDKQDTVIYVGKAKILKNRVRQYFQKNSNHTPKVAAMVSHIAYFEYIVTDSELEALILECNLIKKHRPKYNILLKDDKQYPYIKITLNEDYPRIFMTRTLKNDGARYFGPYMGSSTIKNTLDIIQKIFKPPVCARRFPADIGKGRPCLNYHIKNCIAPCTGAVSQSDFHKLFEDIAAFLDGKHSRMIAELKKEMEAASEKLEFERAAVLRDRIKSISAIDEKQKITNSKNQTDMDLAAFVRDGDKTFAEIFFVRGGLVVGRENYRLENTSELDNSRILTDFIKQFYSASPYIPGQLLLQYDLYDTELIAQWLSERRGKRVSIAVPQRGEKLRLIELVIKNAEIARDNYRINRLKAEEKRKAAFEIGELLGIPTGVSSIEAYDISNISGSSNVASMVVFENGKPCRKRYRKFKIKSFEGQDDYRAMQEVIYRRLSEARTERELVDSGMLNIADAKFLPLPDVIFLDGGRGHISAVEHILEITEVNIPVFGMVKDDKHRTRGLLSSGGEISLTPGGVFFNLITRIQDEVHRTAIEYHRSLRERISSELDNIPGVGEKRRRLLLAELKSVEAVKNADADTLAGIKGIDRKTAESIVNYFKEREE